MCIGTNHERHVRITMPFKRTLGKSVEAKVGMGHQQSIGMGIYLTLQKGCQTPFFCVCLDHLQWCSVCDLARQNSMKKSQNVLVSIREIGFLAEHNFTVLWWLVNEMQKRVFNDLTSDKCL